MKPGDTVYWPDPLPSMAHPDDGKTPPQPVFTGEEKWLKGVVERVVDHGVIPPFEHADTVVAIDPGDGMPVHINRIFVKTRKPSRSSRSG